MGLLLNPFILQLVEIKYVQCSIFYAHCPFISSQDAVSALVYLKTKFVVCGCGLQESRTSSISQLLRFMHENCS